VRACGEQCERVDRAFEVTGGDGRGPAAQYVCGSKNISVFSSMRTPTGYCVEGARALGFPCLMEVNGL